MAKSNGRTSRPQRTSRNAAKAQSTTAKSTTEDSAVVEETDIEITEVEVDADGTTTVEETDIVVTEVEDADENPDDPADDDEKTTAAAKAKTASAKAKSEDTDEDDVDADDADEKPTKAKTESAKTGSAKSAKKDSKKAVAKRTSRSGNPAKRSQGRKTASYTSEAGQQTIKPNPRWFLPVLLGLLIVGLIWLVVFYLTQGAFPVEAWGNWNILIGFAFFVAGLIMSTRWR
ncbi:MULTISPECIES: cell division protein CrgA [Brevibacterium]|uniref:Cell division protein CrgA n=2 Tax=Brevibacterium TaxID=1696 RepID=A0ABP9U2A5_9MICO